MSLVNDGHVSYHEALRQATNPSDFELRMKGIQSTSDSKWENFEHTEEQEEDEPGILGQEKDRDRK
jgi:twitching motility protein PilT